ncbi:SipW-cognate class signal peptide [Agrococcus jejuensis]|uniref:SipW-cognate class signal peptide n=1 Tax=Agrococcus jejuensis TaxID=399736 RepID=A0A1G8B3F3_9MICO|nr:SipW-cognate class signal peptide [Agrococcus jejuensis]
MRVRAVLAGGLVLGIGTTATLAAWNDSEYATATVTASRFGIEGNINATGFTDHATSPGPTLTFSPVTSQMSPNTVSFSSLVIRTTATTNIGGSLVMSTSSAPSDATLAAQLQYAVRVVTAGTTCNQAVFDAASTAANIIVPNGTTLTTAVPANTQSLTAAAGNTVTYCVRLSMPSTAPSSVQGLTTNVTWQWLGTSSA